MNYEIDLAALSPIELAELMAYLQLKNIRFKAVPNDGKPIVSGSAISDKCRYCNESEIIEDGCCLECYRKHCR